MAVRSALLGFHRARRAIQGFSSIRQGGRASQLTDVHWLPVGLADPEDADRVAGATLSRLGIERGFSSAWELRAPNVAWEHCAHSFDFAPPLAMRVREGAIEYLRTLDELVRGWQSRKWPWWHSSWDAEPLASRIQNCLRAGAILNDVPAASSLRDGLFRMAWTGASYLRSTLSTLDGPVVVKSAAALALADTLSGAGAPEPPASVSRLWRVAREQLRNDGTHEQPSPQALLDVLDNLLEVASVVTAAGIVIPLSTQAALARALRAARLLCRPDGRPHTFRSPASTPGASLHRLEIMAAEALVVAPNHELTDMFALPSGGFAGVATDREKLIVRFPTGRETRTTPLRVEAALAFEYCLSGELVFVSRFSPQQSEELRAVPDAPLTSPSSHGWGSIRSRVRDSWRRINTDRHPWLVESRPFVFEGSAAGWSPDIQLHRRIEQLGDGAWRVTDRIDGQEQAAHCLLFDAAWRVTIGDGLEYLARHAHLPQHAVRVSLSSLGARTPEALGPGESAGERRILSITREGTMLSHHLSCEGVTWHFTVMAEG